MQALDDDDRAALGALADLLIPASKKMPSATDADVHNKWIDRAIRARPELEREIRPLIDAAKNEGAEAALTRFKESNPQATEVFLGTISTCYFMHPGVRKKLRYPGQIPIPIADGEAEYYLEDGLLDPVIERGPIYRDVDVHTR